MLLIFCLPRAISCTIAVWMYLNWSKRIRNVLYFLKIILQIKTRWLWRVRGGINPVCQPKSRSHTLFFFLWYPVLVTQILFPSENIANSSSHLSPAVPSNEMVMRMKSIINLSFVTVLIWKPVGRTCVEPCFERFSLKFDTNIHVSVNIKHFLPFLQWYHLWGSKETSWNCKSTRRER